VPSFYPYLLFFGSPRSRALCDDVEFQSGVKGVDSLALLSAIDYCMYFAVSRKAANTAKVGYLRSMTNSGGVKLEEEARGRITTQPIL
jgi:hypothetical protein